ANPGRHVTTITRTGQLIGTPAYMSPEQSRPGILVPDVRSDVFSLGVILHELLTGVLPHSMTGVNVHDGADDRAATTTTAITPSRDVRTIMAKAVDREPGRRYQSAALLAEDLRRFVEGEPIDARSAGAIERAVRFARGNPTVVGAVAATIFALLAGGSVAIVQAIEARHSARLEAAARVSAVAARDEANATLAFLTNMLSAADTDNRGRNVTVREVLDHVAGNVEEEWKDKPLVAAAIEDALGRTYASLGEFSIARDHLEVAYAIRSKRLSADDLLVADAGSSLGTVMTTLGDHSRAATLLTQAVDIRSRLLGPSHPLTFAAMGGLAASLAGQQKFNEAECRGDSDRGNR
ncbi:MAG: tetratricopeptide repeat-containing serine/threonine-protein kinase, partial [Planctomycetota bacterium]|nr:tetratricopeptide repeat-containing serine/threonine-protein kinase [Planctomycetota bacterium]